MASFHRCINQRPIDISLAPRSSHDQSNGSVHYEHLCPESGKLSSVSRPVWITRIHALRNGMNFHTHRKVFGQLATMLGFQPELFKVKLDEGIRVFSITNHRSRLE